MKARTFSVKPAWLLPAAVLWAAGSLAAQNPYILQTATPEEVARVTTQYGLTVVQPIHIDDNIYLVSLPANASRKDLAAIQSDASVREFTPDHEIDTTEKAASPAATSLDPLSDALASHYALQFFGVPVRSGYVQQTATLLIELAAAQQQFPTGNSIVAVIDTGVDPQHPALAGVLVPGYDFVHNLPGLASDLSDLSQSTVAILDQSTVAILDQKNSPLVLSQSTVAILDQSTVAILDGTNLLPKDFGHGTMVAGLIHLVAPTAQIMPLKAFKADGSANLSDVIRAIYYAVDNHAKVINMSFSSRGESQVLRQAIGYAVSHGVFLVAAAGNEGKHTEVYPAAFEGVIGVGSTNKHDQRSMFSNYGDDSAKLAAPGEALVTTFPGNNYAAVWGTSFSAALVSGAVALFVDVAPQLQHYQLGDVFGQGPHIGQDMGDARLDVLASLLFCSNQSSGSGTDN